MIDTVRNFAIDWQDWSSQQNLSYYELSVWQDTLNKLAQIADESGELYRELKESGIL